MSTREAENGQRRGYPLRNDLARLRELRRGAQNLPGAVSRSKLPTHSPSLSFVAFNTST